jgi:Gpi18-like mannosyltransferase
VWIVLICCLNVALLHNTVIWRQVDSVFSFFLVLSIYFLVSKKVFLSVLSFLFAVNMKAQSMIFLPILLLGCWQVMADERVSLRFVTRASAKIFAQVGLVCIVQFLLLLPFILEGTLASVLKAFTQSVDFYPVISANAHNFWMLVLGQERMWTSDAQQYLWFTYKQWGLLLFSLTCSLSLFPLTKYVYKKYAFSLRRKWELYVGTVALCFSSFFLFNTQMHERYMHPALVFALLFALISGKRWAMLWMVLCSMSYALNLEAVLLTWESIHPPYFWDILWINATISLFTFAFALMFFWKDYLVDLAQTHVDSSS